MWNELNYERVVNNLMNDQYFELIIKFRTSTRSDDVSTILQNIVNE